MANEEQLAFLKKSVEEWNKWQEENPDSRIDLRTANLNKFNLRGVNLTGSDLNGADLQGADLSKANLSGANLNEAVLKGTDLREANIMGAMLMEANLRDANLAGANLREAYLRVADLRDSNLREANLKEAILTNCNLRKTNLVKTKFGEAKFLSTHLADLDLSMAEGLEDVKHLGPSPISTSTLQLSKGKIPEAFLRGCGLKDWEIESAKLYREGLSTKEVDDVLYRVHDLRLHQAIQYYSVFISYNTRDQAFAQRLYDDLQNNGVRCWFATEDVQGGKKLHEQIDAAIRTQDRLLLVLSEHSMSSEWVKTEIARARKKEVMEKRRVLFPLGLVPFEKIKTWECFEADVGKDSAREIREYFIPDFSQWEDEAKYKVAFERLLKDLRAKDE